MALEVTGAHPEAPYEAVGSGADLEVAVIGAGPHGLSAAAHMRRAGLQPYVFGDPMSFWRTMPAGMKLRSNLRATNMIDPSGPLSLSAYTRATGHDVEHPVPLERFIDYGTWVQSAAVPDVDRRAVTRLARAPGGFALELDDGAQLTARRVVVACGIADFERLPTGFAALEPERVSHTALHDEFSKFAGARVVVVGGGQSALESAALLTEAGAQRVEALVRAPSVVWLRGHAVIHRLGRLGPILYAPTDVGPLWYSRLVSVPDLFRRLPRGTQDRIARRSIRPACAHFVRVRLGEVTITTGVQLLDARATADGLHLRLSDGTEREADHLMFGTGYEVDVARYPFLDERLLAAVRQVNGYPVLRRGLESSVAGLHFVGAPAAWSFGPVMRFVSGSWYAGRAVASGAAAGLPHARR